MRLERTATTAEMLAWLDKQIESIEGLPAGEGVAVTVQLVQSIRNAVWRDAERRSEDLAEIFRVEKRQAEEGPHQ